MPPLSTRAAFLTLAALFGCTSGRESGARQVTLYNAFSPTEHLTGPRRRCAAGRSSQEALTTRTAARPRHFQRWARQAAERQGRGDRQQRLTRLETFLDKRLYTGRDLIECCFNKLEPFRHVTICFQKTMRNDPSSSPAMQSCRGCGNCPQLLCLIDTMSRQSDARAPTLTDLPNTARLQYPSAGAFNYPHRRPGCCLV